VDRRCRPKAGTGRQGFPVSQKWKTTERTVLEIQAGLSAGCEAVPWTRAPDPKPTFNACVGYYWNKGKDNIYVCDNATNSGKYTYNNLQAYYATWYHKFNEQWHIASEYWYMWEKDVPSIFGPLPAETNANGAWCKPGEDKCFAPEHAVVNYVERQFSIHDSLSIRNEYFDDQKASEQDSSRGMEPLDR
jgi:hypothetical protein